MNQILLDEITLDHITFTNDVDFSKKKRFLKDLNKTLSNDEILEIKEFGEKGREAGEKLMKLFGEKNG